MAVDFSISINIKRDADRELPYIVTPNASNVATQIWNDFKVGFRSFNIIGAYGTGKSSFLLAFQKTLLGKERFFELGGFAGKKIDFISLIGDYRSFSESVAEVLGLAQDCEIEEILNAIFLRFRDLGEKDGILVLCVDEFGKYIEFAIKNHPEKELYFFQQLAELVNDPRYNFLLLTTVHQNFDSYTFGLNRSQQQEWKKVKGRYKEIPFNEPVEQLLFIASEKLKDNPKSSYEKVVLAQELAAASKIFHINKEFGQKVFGQLLPLDPFSSVAITMALQRYGQNERSLFSFLSSQDPYGLSTFDGGEPFFHLGRVYDYLIYNFFSILGSAQNPDLLQWSGLREAIERTEAVVEKPDDHLKIIKAIGLLQILGNQGAHLDHGFFLQYGRFCMGIVDPGKILWDLEGFRIVQFQKSLNRFIFSGGSDLNINLALEQAGAKIDLVSDIPGLLKREIEFDPVLAKRHSYQTGTPRTFFYELSESPISKEVSGEIDGYINLIFTEQISEDQVKHYSASSEEPILFGFYCETLRIKAQLFEIEKTRQVLKEVDEMDKVAIRELKAILSQQEKNLKQYILRNFYSVASEVKWYFEGKNIVIASRREFNDTLSKICDKVYPSAPHYKSELVNRHKLSAAISTAKKAYFKALVDNWGKPDLGFEKQRFPPEKTIFETLLKSNGLYPHSDIDLKVLEGSSFKALWEISESFLESTKTGKRPLTEFLEILRKKPFKLKDGLVDFWVGSFLFLKRNEYSLFSGEAFVPEFTMDILDTLVWDARNYQIKAFHLEGVRLDIFNNYRRLLNQTPTEDGTTQTLLETLRPFLSFYKGLPEYSRKTNLLQGKTLKFRKAIEQAKDPERLFFVDFPAAVGISPSHLQESDKVLLAFSDELQQSIRELRGAYSALIDRLEAIVVEETLGEKWEFPEWQRAIQRRFEPLKISLVLQHQKAFLAKLRAPIDERENYIVALCQALLGKSANVISDEEEHLFRKRFKEMVFELDNLLGLEGANLNPETETLLGIQVSSFAEGIKKSLVRLSKIKEPEVEKVENALRGLLSSDKSINIAAIANILREQIGE